MKRFRSFFSAVLITTAIGALTIATGTGCRTAAPGAPSTPSTTWLKPDRIQKIANLASYSGAVIDLRSNPGHRKEWQITYDGLTTLTEQETWTIDSALIVLSAMPVKFFTSAEGELSLTGALLLSDAFGTGEFDAANSEQAKALIVGLRKGIGMALGANIPPANARSIPVDPILVELKREAAATR